MVSTFMFLQGMSQPFLFQASDVDGRRVHEQVEAATMSQARYALELRGYRDIEFFTDDAQASIAAMLMATSDVPPADPDAISPEEQMAAMRRRGVGAHLWWALKKQSIVAGPLAAWNVASFVGARPFGWGDWTGFVLSALFVGVFFKLSAPYLLYQKILEAVVWGDWTQVTRFVGWARAVRRFMPLGIPESELDFREAQALAAGGRMDAALARVTGYRGRADFPEHHYFSRLASLYEYAGDFGGVLDCLEQALAKSPDGVNESIDLATARVRWFQDVAGAKAALVRVADAELAVLPRAAFRLCAGMIAVEERDHARAQELLDQAITDLEAFASNLLVQAIAAEAQGYRVLALVQAGKLDEAVDMFSEARPWLKVVRPPLLFERCRAALGASTAQAA